MPLLDFFKPAPKELGALIDNRTVEEKLKDFKFEEIVASAAPVVWKEKKTNDWRRFPVFNQNGSGSCVAQTGAKLLGINYYLKNNGEYVHFSATDIYKQRANKPSGGMNAVDAWEIIRRGVTLEDLVRSQKMTDAQMDGVFVATYKRKVGDIFKIENYVALPVKNLELVASTIQQTQKGLMTWFFFTSSEWGREVPIVKDPNLNLYADATSRHSVAAVDFGLIKGKKHIRVEDTAHFSGYTEHFINEDFFSKRNFYVGYPLDFKFEEGVDPNKPHYNFTKDLKFSSVVTYGNPDIIALQNCLKWLGFFPKNVDSTGYFGAITKKGVEQFQASKGLVQDGIVGGNTRAELNKIFFG